MGPKPFLQDGRQGIQVYRIEATFAGWQVGRTGFILAKDFQKRILMELRMFHKVFYSGMDGVMEKGQIFLP